MSSFCWFAIVRMMTDASRACSSSIAVFCIIFTKYIFSPRDLPRSTSSKSLSATTYSSPWSLRRSTTSCPILPYPATMIWFFIGGIWVLCPSSSSFSTLDSKRLAILFKFLRIKGVKIIVVATTVIKICPFSLLSILRLINSEKIASANSPIWHSDSAAFSAILLPVEINKIA